MIPGGSIIVFIGDVCGQIDDSKSWRKDIKNWYKGLSGDIGDLCDQLTMIRARLSVCCYVFYDCHSSDLFATEDP